jgi:hypothetical protein
MSTLNFQLIHDSKSKKRNNQGFLEIKARATRTGIQEYPELNQTHYRPAIEVFNQDSINSLKKLPVSVFHPPEPITISNAKKYSIGFTDSEVQKSSVNNEDFLEINLVITDENTAQRVERKELVEVSMGYTADRIPESGEVEGKKYNVVQKNIVYNHVALLPIGNARAGRNARILNDSNMIFDSYQTNNEINNSNIEGQKMASVNISGITFEVNDQLKQAYENQEKQNKSVMDSVADLGKQLSEAKGKAESLETQLKSQPNLNEIVMNRLKLVNDAKLKINDVNKITYDMDDIAIKKAVIQDRLPSVVLDSNTVNNESFLNGLYTGIQPIEKNVNDQKSNIIDALNTPGKNQNKKDLVSLMFDAKNSMNDYKLVGEK